MLLVTYLIYMFLMINDLVSDFVNDLVNDLVNNLVNNFVNTLVNGFVDDGLSMILDQCSFTCLKAWIYCVYVRRFTLKVWNFVTKC